MTDLARFHALMRAARIDPSPLDEFEQLAFDVGEWLDAVERCGPHTAGAIDAHRVEDVLRLLDAALNRGDQSTRYDLASACRAAMSGRSLAPHVLVVSNRAREYERLLTEIGDAAGCGEFARIAEHIRAQNTKETT